MRYSAVLEKLIGLHQRFHLKKLFTVKNIVLAT